MAHLEEALFNVVFDDRMVVTAFDDKGERIGIVAVHLRDGHMQVAVDVQGSNHPVVVAVNDDIIHNTTGLEV